MNHLDYKQLLEKDTDYQEALEELKDHFALGDIVIRERTRKGLSQAQLAEMVGTKQANISRLESGEGNPTLKFISRVLKALDLQIRFESQTTTSTYKAIPATRIPAPNWPRISSTSTQTVGSLK